ncbi:hypothetical protein [Advenella sp.]|uniref:hypothetical protein n=1 Tax=Advenella sp. TaxID=1872388 RepID=UPI00338DA91F
MKAPVACCPGTVARTQASSTVTAALAEAENKTAETISAELIGLIKNFMVFLCMGIGFLKLC